MKQYKYYLFDMGSTLLEFHNPEWNEPEILNVGHHRLINHISKNYGKVIAEKIDNNVIMPWYNYIENNRKIERIEYRIDEALFFEFIKSGINVSYKEIIEILKTDYLDFYNYAHPNEGVIDYLKILKEKECKIAVVSNILYPKEIYLEIFKREGLDPFIDAYSFSYENTYMKPHRSLFLKAMMLLNAKIPETIMIGDNEKADIQGAKKLGLSACLYTGYAKKVTETQADYIITNFKEGPKQVPEISPLVLT